ncbi:MAG: ABC transporter substrate-binding protein [bacterium]
MRSVWQQRPWTRRQFLGGLALAGTAGLAGPPSRLFADLMQPSRAAAAEPPPETTTIRLLQPANICQAPLYVAEEFLRREGFTDVQYVRTAGGAPPGPLASGEVDIGMTFVGPNIIGIERGAAIVLLAGVHVGCFELFGTDRVNAIRDLKGKTVAAVARLGPEYAFLISIAAYVGLDPHKDINWVSYPPGESVQLLAEGKIDAFMALPPVSQELRSKKIGHVVVSSMMDRPWSQYFCCMVAGNREFVRKHPVATKRALRAILKASDVTAREPARAARMLIARGVADRYDYALQAIREISYGRWRDYDPEDTVRFYALRLHEGGMIRSSPVKILALGTNWRFLNEIKKETKG